MSEANKALVRRWLAEADRRKTLPEEDLTPDYAAHFPGMPAMDARAQGQFTLAFYSAFPDLVHELQDMVAEGDSVAALHYLRGTHQGEFMGIPATGKRIEVPVIGVVRTSGGKIRELRIVVDMMGLMQQIGAVPAPRAAQTIG